MVDGKSKLTVIQQEADYGLYVWYTKDNKVLGSEGNILNIPARKFDIEAIAKISQAGAHYGYPDGHAVWWPGVMRIDDEEHSVQIDRMKQGLIPSETDIGAWADAAKGLRAHGE